MNKRESKFVINNNSSTNNRTFKLRDPKITTNPKYEEIEEKFIKLFKIKGYVQSDSFDNKVWFLKDDILFQSISNKNKVRSNTLSSATSKFINKNNDSLSATPTPNALIETNIIHSILEKINENSDFDNLLVSVEVFIYKVIESILLAQETVKRSSNTIDSFQAVKRNLIIKENISILEKKIQKMPIIKKLNSSGGNTLSNISNIKDKDPSFQSKLKTKIIKAFNLLPGKYEFVLKYFEILSNNMNQKNIILINNEDRKVTISNTGEIVENRYLANEFEPIMFSALDIDESYNLKFKSSNNSGSSFSNFSIGSVEFESKKAFLLDIMLNSIDNILNISKMQFKENLELNLNSTIIKRNSSKNINVNKKENIVQKSIILECSFEFDLITRCTILKRISNVFSEVIETNRLSQSIIDQILENYFEEIGDGVKYILSKSQEIQKDACCDCNIF